MPMTRADIDRLLAILVEAADIEIMPRFAALNPADIKVKSHASDFVTVADEAAERLIERRLREAYGDSFLFVGEEVMERDPGLIDRIPDADLSFIVDPIDGTFNFANGVPAFAVILAVAERGNVVAGLIYDPIRRDAACALAGGGAWIQGGGRPDAPLRVATPAPLSETIGSAGWAYAPDEVKRRLFEGFPLIWGASNYRCGGQEFRMLTSGATHFAYFWKLSPWDHAAGWLIHKEAGGYSALQNGDAYHPTDREGGLLLAPDEASWRALHAALLG